MQMIQSPTKIDAVAMKREIQERMAREYAALSPDERRKSERFRWLGATADSYLAAWQATWEQDADTSQDQFTKR
jgi:hypothetical protein